MGSTGEGGGSSWPPVTSHHLLHSHHPSSYGPDSEDEDDSSSKDGSLKESGNGDDMGSGGGGGSDAEGVWSPDIEQSFQEALAIYPPCGRRKIILSDEGKMYGRNELIARYIKIRTGKTRTRKQVSSHIQVLARRKAREVQSKIKNKSSAANGPSGHGLDAHHHLNPAIHHHATHVATAAAGLAALGIAPPNSVPFWPTGGRDDIKPLLNGNSVNNSNHAMIFKNNDNYNTNNNNNNNNNNNRSVWDGRCIESSKLRLIEFAAFADTGINSQDRHLFVSIGRSPYSDLLEEIDLRQICDKFPSKEGGLRHLYDKGPDNAFFLVKFWADLNIPGIISEDGGAFYGVTSHFESLENVNLTCSTKVCSFGKQVVEKVELIDPPVFTSSRYIYRLDRSEMCEYMINFIHKLKDLPEKYMMNSVLENFTILQVISNTDTKETLLCIAFVFEVSVSDNGAQHHIYRLVKPNSNDNNM